MMKNTKRNLLLLWSVFVFCLMNINIASAQRYRDRSQDGDNSNRDYENPDSLQNMSFADRLVKGANFDLGLGTSTYIDISPVLGYRLTPKLQAGIGLTYIYINTLYGVYDAYGNLIGSARDIETAYGGRVYAEYDFAKNVLSRNSLLFAHVEYENMNVPYQNPYNYGIDRYWLPSPYVGLGMRSAIGKKAYLNFCLMYNVNYSAYANYNPNGPLVYRIGITF